MCVTLIAWSNFDQRKAVLENQLASQSQTDMQRQSETQVGLTRLLTASCQSKNSTI